MESHPSVDIHTLEGGDHALVGRVKRAASSMILNGFKQLEIFIVMS